MYKFVPKGIRIDAQWSVRMFSTVHTGAVVALI